MILKTCHRQLIHHSLNFNQVPHEGDSVCQFGPASSTEEEAVRNGHAYDVKMFCPLLLL